MMSEAIVHKLARMSWILGRFRLIYVSAQYDTQVWQVAELPQVADSIHVISSRM